MPELFYLNFVLLLCFFQSRHKFPVKSTRIVEVFLHAALLTCVQADRFHVVKALILFTQRPTDVLRTRARVLQTIGMDIELGK